LKSEPGPNELFAVTLCYTLLQCWSLHPEGSTGGINIDPPEPVYEYQ